jgi:predicted transcriptional regulator
MDKQSFPTLHQDRRTISERRVASRVDGILGSVDSDSPADAPLAGTVAVSDLKISKSISSMMERNLCTVDAEDTVGKVEEVLATQGCSSVSVMGSNGLIVGIIGPQELAHFLSEKKNANAAHAWEISRCTMFEVNPDDSVEDVATLMAENKIEYIAVTERGVLKGVVSTRDLVQVVLKENIGQKV